MNGAIKKPVSTDSGEAKPRPPAGALPCRDSTESVAGEFWLIAGAVARFLGATGGVALVTAVCFALAFFRDSPQNRRYYFSGLSQTAQFCICARKACSK